MSAHITIRKGLNIKLAGAATREIISLPQPETFALKPADFNNVIPKLLVKQGDEVKAGTPLFFDKNNEQVLFCAPVSGEIAEIRRVEKRRIAEVIILADKNIDYITFPRQHPNELDRKAITETLLQSGAWPFIRQRPFGCIANPLQSPKSIFISAFDSNPLAPDNNYILADASTDFQTGLDALKKLTDGPVHLNTRDEASTTATFNTAKGVQINRVAGPHPAGNIGVQIHHIDPVNKGETVWFIQPQDVRIIGKLFNEGKFDCSRVIAVTGSQVIAPTYYTTLTGSAIHHLLANSGIKEGQNRIISGNVLTGTRIMPDGYLGFYDSQLTVIPEGNESEFMGWIAPGLEKFSISRTFFSWLTPNKIHTLNTNLHGEERPFVVTGEYEKVFPMDIYPVHLLKSILIEDVDMMEKLGIYEVTEEDFALCEFVCTSKIKSQEIIRQGLDLIRREFS